MHIRNGIEIANLSDLGHERENNEDYFGYYEPEADDEFLRKGRLAIVADGMGGEEGGEVASRLVVDTIRESYFSQPELDIRQCLIHAFEAARDALLECVRQYPAMSQMGTTCTAVAIMDHQAHVGHVGDSRLYLIRGCSVFRLTHDHTAVRNLIERGVITADEAEAHPQRHVLTAALSAHLNLTADFSPFPVSLETGDRLVLCTDGLWGQVSDDELVAIVSNSTPTEACRQLIRLAKHRGGPDNITVQILRVSE